MDREIRVRKFRVNRTLRIAMFQTSGIIEVANDGNGKVYLTGMVGKFIDQLINGFRRIAKFKTIIVPTPPRQSVGNYIGNGTYDGVVGLLQSKKADIFPVPFAMNYPPSAIDYGPPVQAVEARVVQAITAGTGTRDIAHCFTLVPPEIWLWLLSSLFLLSFTLQFLNKNTKGLGRLLNDIFSISRTMYNQATVYGTRSELFVLFTSHVAYYFYTLAFLNSINSEMVVKDFSTFVDSLDDVIRRTSMRPTFIDDGSGITEYFRHGVNEKYRAIWNRAVRIGLHKCLYKMDVTDFSRSQNDKADDAFIADQNIATLVCKLACQSDKTKKHWMSREQFQEITYALYYSKYIDRSIKKKFDMLSLILLECGVIPHHWKDLTDNFVMFGNRENCILKTKDEYFEDDNLTLVISLRNVSVMFTVYAGGVLIALYIMLLEGLSQLVIYH